MTRFEFLDALQKELGSLPESDIKASIQYYNEMIDDKMEDGLTEEAAVADIGNPQKIADGILSDVPLSKLVKNKIKQRRRLSALEIILLILGSPVWLSLLIAVFAVIISLYASLWAVIISLWAVFASFAASSPCGIAAGIIFIFKGDAASGVAMLSVGIVCAGLSIFVFYGCDATTKGILMLTKKMAIWTKNCFRGRDEAR